VDIPNIRLIGEEVIPHFDARTPGSP
jgi:hypothetical protein